MLIQHSSWCNSPIYWLIFPEILYWYSTRRHIIAIVDIANISANNNKHRSQFVASEDVGRPQDHRECLHDKTSRSLAGLNWLDRRLREKNHSNKNPDRHITAKMKVIKKVNKKEMKKKTQQSDRKGTTKREKKRGRERRSEYLRATTLPSQNVPYSIEPNSHLLVIPSHFLSSSSSTMKTSICGLWLLLFQFQLPYRMRAWPRHYSN